MVASKQLFYSVAFAAIGIFIAGCAKDTNQNSDSVGGAPASPVASPSSGSANTSVTSQSNTENTNTAIGVLREGVTGTCIPSEATGQRCASHSMLLNNPTSCHNFAASYEVYDSKLHQISRIDPYSPHYDVDFDRTFLNETSRAQAQAQWVRQAYTACQQMRAESQAMNCEVFSMTRHVITIRDYNELRSVCDSLRSLF